MGAFRDFGNSPQGWQYTCVVMGWNTFRALILVAVCGYFYFGKPDGNVDCCVDSATMKKVVCVDGAEDMINVSAVWASWFYMMFIVQIFTNVSFFFAFMG